jgi:hypothetical protein
VEAKSKSSSNRYSSIPVRVFSDEGDRQIHFHMGFLAEDKILEKSSEIGVAK